MPMRILVTGSEGLIGSEVAAALERAGHGARRMDIRVPEGAEGRASILDAGALDRLAAGCDGIIHLAAISRVVHGELDPDLCNRTNIDGTARVIEAAGRSGAWLLFSSSREVYGEPLTLPVDESHPLMSINTYGATKVAGEALCRAFSRETGIETRILRIANAFGPRDIGRVIPSWIEQARAGNDLTVYGGDQILDFIWVADWTTDRLVKYDLNGRYILDIGGHGAQPGQFDGVHQISVDQERNLYVTEVANDRSQKFRPKADADPAKIIGPPVGGWAGGAKK